MDYSNLFLIQAQLSNTPYALTRKSFVDFIHIDIALFDPGFLERHRDGFPRSDAHQQRLHADHGARDEFPHDRLAEPLGGTALHQEHRRRAVGDLACVSGVDAAVLGKRGLDLGEAVGGDARSDPIVFGNRHAFLFLRLWVEIFHRDGRNLLVEFPSLLRLGRLLITPRCKRILIRSLDPPIPGHLLAERSHGNLAVPRFWVALQQFRKLRYSPRPILAGHALYSCSDTHFDHPRPDRIRDINHCL